ncbi:IS1380 family transposase, partial [Arthrobacter sp. AETb3-4]|nr:IS1380 family transposase [Arthrobacter wenxiniae]
MKVSHTVAALSVSFDEENLVSPTGLVPVMRLAENAGLHALADEWLSIP